MNLPNKLTLFRILLIPIIMIVYSVEHLRTTYILWNHLTQANFIVLLLIFIGAMTDFLDGQIARRRNLVTNLGKFLDPLADKLLTLTGFIILLEQNAQNDLMYKAVGGVAPNLLTWWMVIIIIAREFMVTGIRLLAAGQGKVIAASKLGKIKTTLQFVTIIYLLLGGAAYCNGTTVVEVGIPLWFELSAKILLIAMVAMTIFSGYDYLEKNIGVLKETKKKLSKNK